VTVANAGAVTAGVDIVTVFITVAIMIAIYCSRHRRKLYLVDLSVSMHTNTSRGRG